MVFFKMPRFIRRYIRRTMHPMAEKKAWSMKTRLSVAYALIAWHTMGYVCYQMYKGNKSWPLTMGIRDPIEDTARPAVQWAHTLGLSNAKVVRMKNLTQISSVDEIHIEVADPVMKKMKSRINDTNTELETTET